MKGDRNEQKKKSESRGIPISDEGLDYIERIAKKAAETNPQVKELHLPHILRYVAMIREHIRENDARRAVTTTAFLCQRFYEAEIDKPFYPRLKVRMANTEAARKSVKSREKKFDWYAIQKEASEIWKRYNSYSKLRVAEIIRDRLEKRSEQNIPGKEAIRKKISKPA